MRLKLLVTAFLLLLSLGLTAQNKKSHTGNCDTSYNVSLEGLSSEGGEGVVCVKDGQIASVSCTLYGETGKVLYTFSIYGNKITIDKRIYHYTKPLAQVQNDDIKLQSRNRYTVSSNQFVRKTTHPDDAMVFLKVKATVPKK